MWSEELFDRDSVRSNYSIPSDQTSCSGKLKAKQSLRQIFLIRPR